MAKLDHTYENVLKDLGEAYEADHDGREKAREADHFINKRDGQWEPEVIKLYDNKPRYTIDLTSGIVSAVFGEMASMDFDIKVYPAGGPATTELALHYDGLIRNIENNSGAGAKYIYRAAGKQMITTGIGGWGVKQGYRDSTSFDQDLMIYPISNFMDRVWFQAGAILQDMSDSDYGFKLTTMSMRDYKKQFPKGSELSVGQDLSHNVYSYKASNTVTVCEYAYKKYEKQTLVRMTNGAVYIEDDKFNSIKDELQEQGIVVDRTREIEAVKVYQKIFDGDSFITDAEETVFTYIPYIPVYGNFEISEDKVIYWGLVEKHMDPQRILNYIESRKVAEGALAPRAKKWMTAQQAAGYEETLRTMNTNNDPVQFYNHVEGQQLPFETGGAQTNPGLSETASNMISYMQTISGKMDTSMQHSIGLQSGVALQVLQNKSDVSNYEWFNAMEIAIAHTCKVLGEAIPRVYDAQRELQLDSQDGTSKKITINQRVFDKDSGKFVEINDLSQGVYNFVCKAGPAFHNRQQETVSAFHEVAAIDPTILQTGADVYLNNIPAPGMQVMAKRKRKQMVAMGIIPFEELTDEEKKDVQKQQELQKKQGPSAAEQAMLITAEAEKRNSDALTQKALANTEDIKSKIKEREQKSQLEIANLRFAADKERQEKMLQYMKAQDDQLKTLAETLKIIKEAIGANTIIGPSNTEAYEKQSDKLLAAIATSK